MNLHILKIREDSYYPALFGPRRRSERALLSAIQQAYVGGDRLGEWTAWSRLWAATEFPNLS